jgi:hypothetical protein
MARAALDDNPGGLEQLLMPGETGRRFEYRTAGQANDWAAPDQYRDVEPEVDWWDDFVRQVLGNPSAVPPEKRMGLKILAE